MCELIKDWMILQIFLTKLFEVVFLLKEKIILEKRGLKLLVSLDFTGFSFLFMRLCLLFCFVFFLIGNECLMNINSLKSSYTDYLEWN